MKESRSHPSYKKTSPTPNYLTFSLSGRQGEEAGADSVHAEIADYLECDGEEQNAMAGCRQSASLSFKAVADRIFFAVRALVSTRAR